MPAGGSEPIIGIITALPKEYAAVYAMLDEPVDDNRGRRNQRKYVKGSVRGSNGGVHHVALALLPQIGNNAAAHRATLLLEHFPQVRTLLIVGIAGGAPNHALPSHHVRLGDIVVSGSHGIIQYDYVAETLHEAMHRHPPRPPSASLLEAVNILEADELSGQRPWLTHVKRAAVIRDSTRPDAATDVLLATPPGTGAVPHPHDPDRRLEEPRVFVGVIGSANKLVRNSDLRDRMRDKFKIRAFEMEGSGIADASWGLEVGYLAIRGICDYCDSAKNDTWQNYAAVVAAAYMRALLESIPASEKPEHAVVSGQQDMQLTQPEQKARLNYLQTVRRHVDNLLKASLHGTRFIELGIIDHPESIDSPIYQELNSFHTVTDAFHACDRRLLLLGAPGAGKSVTLLHLARKVLDEAEADPQAPVPLLVNLSRFRVATAKSGPRARVAHGLLARLAHSRAPEPSNELEFEEWLIEELDGWHVKKSVAERWIKGGRIAAFLDGLDEVGDTHRAELIELLNKTFLRDYPESVVVVCSRIAEYLPLQDRETRFRLTGAIELRPLGDAQINAYLAAASATGLTQALTRDPPLRELAETPLTLSMMTLAYGNQSAASIPSFARLADQRHHLMQSFVHRMLQRKERRDRGKPFDDTNREVPIEGYRYLPERVDRYLSWLAVRLSLRMQTTFSLRDFFGFLRQRSDFEEHRSAAWIMRLPWVTLLMVLLALVATASKPTTGVGITGAAAVVLSSGVLYCTIRPSGLLARMVLVVVAAVWLLAIPWALYMVSPVALSVCFMFIALCVVLVVISLMVDAYNDDKNLLDGLMNVIGVAYNTAVNIVFALFVVGGIVYLVNLTHIADSPGPVALSLIAGLLTCLAMFDDEPVLFGVAIATITSSLLGGIPVAILTSAACGVVYVTLEVVYVDLAGIVAGSNRNAGWYARAMRRLKRPASRWILTPAAQAVAALGAVLPWHLSTFLRYSGQALLLKPFDGNVEFTHRLLRDYFALRGLLPRLKDADASGRVSVIEALGFQGVSAIETLVELLTDGGATERAAAIGALGRIAAPEVAGHLMRALRDKSPEVRRAVVSSLGNVRDNDYVAILCAAIDDADLEVVKAVIDAASSESLQRKAPADSKAERRLRAAVLRRMLAQDHQVRELVRYVANKAPSSFAGGLLRLARELAAEANATKASSSVEIGPGAGFPPATGAALRALLASLELWAQILACVWVSTSGSDQSVSDGNTLTGILCSDENAHVRAAAADALGVVGDSKVVSALINALRNSNNSAMVRSKAATALGARRDPQAFEALVGALSDTDLDVRCSAVGALATLDDARVTDCLVSLANSSNEHLRQAVLQALASRSGDSVFEAIVGRLTDRSPAVRIAAASSLGRLGDRRAVDPLIRALSDRSSNVRASAANSLGELRDTLGELRDTLAVEALVEATADEDLKVRSAASLSLLALHDSRGEKAALAVLPQLAKNDVATWGRLLDGLVTWNSVATCDAVQTYLVDDSPEKRTVAVRALARKLQNHDAKLLAETPYFGGTWSTSEFWLDPLYPITLERVELCASTFDMSTDEVKMRYERLAPGFHLRLSWLKERQG